jgi:hypothetical protein
MSRFEYDLIDDQGRAVRESLEADDYPSAMREIQERGFCVSLVEITESGERIVHFGGLHAGATFGGCLFLIALVVVPLTVFVGLELAGQGIGAALGLPVWGQVLAGFFLLHLSFKLFLWWTERRLERLKIRREPNDDPERW